jgi:hypothetical protein
MDELQLKEFIRRLWITRKCRIVASERVKRENDLFQSLIVYYSIILVGLSIWDIQSNLKPSKSSLLILIASVTLSLFSTFVASKNYNERHFNLKNCYIELDKLYIRLKEIENQGVKTSTQIEDITEKYNNILKCVENHSELDYVNSMSQIPEEQEKISKEKISEFNCYKKLMLIRNISYFVLPVIAIFIVAFLFK